MNGRNARRRRKRRQELEARLEADPELQKYPSLKDVEAAAKRSETVEAALDLGPARDAVALRLMLLGERLRAVLGDDYGISGDEIDAGFITDLDTCEVAVLLNIAGRIFGFHPEDGDSIALFRQRVGLWEYAEVDGEGEPVGPWCPMPAAD